MRKGLFRLCAVVSLVGGMLAFGNTTASATDIGGIFQLDGNPQDAAVATAPDDWETLKSSTAKDAGFVAATAMPLADSDSPTDKTYFTGGGSKDVRDTTAWQYSSGDVAPDKDEILNAAAAGYKIDTDGDGAKELIVFFTADRFANDGDSQIGFWFFGNVVGPDGAGKFTGSHKAGDILVLSDFSQGGSVANVSVFEWIGGKNPLKQLATGTGSVDCDAASHNPFVCAIENDGPTPTLWPYTPKSGPANSYPTGSFLEGGINVTKLLGGTSTCFASFLAETRSSTSPTAQLKDFAGGSFPVCAPKTELSISQSPTGDHHAGDVVTLTYSDINKGTGPLSSPSVSDDNCSTVVEKKTAGFNDGDANQNSLFDINETWLWTCQYTVAASTLTHTATAHGTDANFNNVDVTYCANPTAPPTGVFCSQTERAVLTLSLINPSTILSISASATTIHAGESVTFTYKEKNDGDSPISNSPFAISVEDDNCSPVTQVKTAGFNNGDTDKDGVLDINEEWVFSCTKNVSGTETHTALGHGTDSAGADVTYVASGTCSNSATVHCVSSEKATLTITAITSGTELTINASATVTYTFTEENKGSDPLTSVSVDTTLTGCANPATAVLSGGFNVGDTDADSKLDAGEKWKFTCTGPALTWKTGDADAVQSNTGTGHGTDLTGADVTWGTGCISTPTKVCDIREQKSVAVTISG
jgi:hypothetical protein